MPPVVVESLVDFRDMNPTKGIEIMNANDELLRAIKGRGKKQTEHGYGVITADRYVRQLSNAIGLACCNKHAATEQASFDDLIQKAAGTLVYSNPEMVIEQKRVDDVRKLVGDVELPKNVLMVFKHTLTTTTKDRDGDIMHSDGAEPDPKMLLLFQHIPTLPIGKMLGVADQTDQWLKLYSAIVDINETSHDAAVMLDNGMGRFSHGFRALEFDEIKSESKAGRQSVSGFDIKRFEIMEESLVSVAANPDAETEEIILSLVEGGKLTSPLLKEYGKSIRSHRPVSVPGTTIEYREQLGDSSRELKCGSFADLKAAADAGLVGEKENSDENKSGNRKEKDGATGTRPSEETVEGVEGEGVGEKKATDDKVSGEKSIYLELDGSWECIERKLREKAKDFLAGSEVSVGADDWVGVIATYADYAILQLREVVDYTDMYYKAFWRMEDGEPEFNGSPTEVEISAEVSEKMLEEKSLQTKQGRMLSKANEKKIQDAHDDVVEVKGMDGMSRSSKALLGQAARGLGGVLSSLSSEDTKSYTTEGAMAYVLVNATQKELRRMADTLATMEDVNKSNEKARQYRAAIR